MIDVLQNDFSGGMNVLAAPHEIEDNEAVYIKDFILNESKQLRSRGPVKPISGITNPTGTPGDGNLFVTTDPAGTTRLAYVASGNLYVWRGAVIGWVDVADHMGSAVDGGQALGGGMWIGAQDGTMNLTYWRGGGNPNYSTGTITINHTTHFDPTHADYCGVSGTTTAWTNTVTPGMFLFVSGYCIGVVARVTSDTSLILEAPALYSGSDASDLTAVGYGLTSVRGFFPQEVTGRITTSSSSTTVTGSDTAFTTLTGTNLIFRASDRKYLGQVSSVAHDRGLTLGANAKASVQNEEYIALPSTAEYDQDFADRKSKQDAPGVITAVHSFAQWYAYQNAEPNQDGEFRLRVWRSDPRGPECINLKRDFLHIPSTRGTKINKLVSVGDQLMVFTNKDVYGIVGDTPETFSPVKVFDDGLIRPLLIQQYGVGCVWAGSRGVYLYDGNEITNLAGKLGRYYPIFAPYLFGGSLRYQDYFILAFDDTPPTNGGLPQADGASPSYPDASTALAIYIPTGGVSFLWNTTIRGSVNVPRFTDDNSHNIDETTLYLVVTTTDALRVCDAQDLLRVKDVTSIDTITCRGALDISFGPVPYFESKKFDLGDRTRSKVWRKVHLSYALANETSAVGAGAIRPGISRKYLGTAIAYTFPATSTSDVVWGTATRRFDTRERYCGIQLYTSDVGNRTYDIDYICLEARSLLRSLR